MSQREPTPALVRERLHLATHYELVQKFIYLSGCRLSEATDPRYQIEAQDFNVEEYEGEEFLTLTLRTAKRSGLQRVVASSLRYDPLARDILDGVQEYMATGGPVFNMNPRTVERAVERTFWGLKYPIMKYSVTVENLEPQASSDLRKRLSVDGHWRIFNVHALRHLRATELSQHYGFTGEDLSRFMGWTLASAKMSNMIERYEIYNWRKYGPRLLARPPWAPPAVPYQAPQDPGHHHQDGDGQDQGQKKTGQV